jgi:hypothetical protein
LRAAQLRPHEREWFVLGSSAVDDQHCAGCRGALVSREMYQVSRNNHRFSGFQECRSMTFDFYGESAVDHVKQFLGTRVHVPRRSATGGKFDDARDGLLDGLVLPFKVLPQDLGQLGGSFGIRLRVYTSADRGTQTEQP